MANSMQDQIYVKENWKDLLWGLGAKDSFSN